MASWTRCGGMRTIRVCTVDDAAAVAVDVERVVRLDPHTRALKDLKGAEVDVVELGFGEHGQAEPS